MGINNNSLSSLSVFLFFFLLYAQSFGESITGNTNNPCNSNLIKGSYFEGECSDQNIPIKGVITTPDGDVMRGEFDGIHRGDYFKGSVTYKNFEVLTDEGVFEKFLLEGKGKRIYSDGNIFDGYFKNHNPEKGTLTYKDGTKYIGTFKTENGLSQFQNGERLYSDGTVEKGSFNNWKLNGSGTRIYPNNKKEIGIFSNGELTISHQEEMKNIEIITQNDKQIEGFRAPKDTDHSNEIKNLTEDANNKQYPNDSANELNEIKDSKGIDIFHNLLWIVPIIIGAILLRKNQIFEREKEKKDKLFCEKYKQLKKIGIFLKDEEYLQKIIPLKIVNKINKYEVIHSSLEFRIPDTRASADWSFERPFWTEEEDASYKYALELSDQKYHLALVEYKKRFSAYEIEYGNYSRAKIAWDQNERHMRLSSKEMVPGAGGTYSEKYTYNERSYPDSPPPMPSHPQRNEPNKLDYCHYETLRGKCGEVNYKPGPRMVSLNTKFKTSLFSEISIDLKIAATDIFNIYSKILSCFEKKSLSVNIDSSIKSFEIESEELTLDQFRWNLNFALKNQGEEIANMVSDDRNFQLSNDKYAITSRDLTIPIIIFIFNRKNKPKKNEIYICDHKYPELINFKLSKSNIFVNWIDKLF